MLITTLLLRVCLPYKKLKIALVKKSGFIIETNGKTYLEGAKTLQEDY